MEGHAEEIEEEIRQRSAVSQIPEGIHEDEDGDGVAHEVGEEDDTVHADADGEGKRNVFDSLAEEVHQQGHVEAGADEDEEVVIVEDGLASRHQKLKSGFEAPLVDGEFYKFANLECLKFGIVGVPVVEAETSEAEEDDDGQKGQCRNAITRRLLFPAFVDESQESQEGDKEEVGYGVFHVKSERVKKCPNKSLND